MRINIQFKKAIFLCLLLVSSAVMVACGGNETSGDSDSSKESSSSDYPSGDIQVIVPYSAGGGTDAFARIVSHPLEQALGKSVIIVNRPGAAGETGMTEIAEGNPDGYNLGFVSFPDNEILPLYKETSYSNDQFKYLASFTGSSTVLILKEDSPFETLEDFVNYAKEHPGELTIAASGDGHIYNMLQLEQEAGIKVTPVRYSGAGDNLNAVLGGHVDAAFLAQQFAIQTEEHGLKTLAIAGDTRADFIPDVPTFKELGFDVDVVLSRVLVAPADTPQEVVDILIEKLEEVGKDEAFQEKVIESGETYHFLSGPELIDYMAEHSNRIKNVIEGNEEIFNQ
ncbi:tripartite tricarboxylate transporter substrate binding protein [bacterium LRH843]|nr:tripartite tricarboxylate transporter substrate binding protein [bacterium LRH843]